MAKRQKLISGSGDNQVVVYGDLTKLSEFVSGFTAAADQGATNSQNNRRGGTVRQYPGDTSPFTRSSANVETLKAPTAIPRTLPGKSFTVEVTTGIGPLKKTDVTQFTFTGPFSKLHAKFVSGAAKALVLRSPGGKPYLIADPTP